MIFANTGVAQLAPFVSVDGRFYDLHFDVNVKGLFVTVQKGLPLMNDGGEVIILTASIAPINAFPAVSVYSATKAVVRSVARTWTNELRERRNRVNAISPGHIDTPRFEGWQQGDALIKMKEDLAKSVPLAWAGWEIPTSLPKLSHSSPPMKPAISPVSNSLSMSASVRFKPKHPMWQLLDPTDRQECRKGRR